MKISHYKAIGKGAMVASFNLTLPKMGDFQIRGITLFESNGKRWITMPSRAYDDPADPSKKKYFAYVGFEDRAVNQKFQDSVMKVLDEHIKTLPVQVNHSISIGSMMADDSEDDGLPF